MAVIAAVVEAVTPIAAALVMTLVAANASVRFSKRLRTSAPAPDTETPAVPPSPTLSAAAAPNARMEPECSALITTEPTEVATSARRIEASTAEAIRFSTNVTPIEMLTPAVPPRLAATETAAANAVIVALSDASTVSSRPRMFDREPLAGPSMVARTTEPIRFSVLTPEPLRATPADPPAAAATDPANTVAPIRATDIAWTTMSPGVATSESSMTAAVDPNPVNPAPLMPMELFAIATPIDAPTPLPPPRPAAAEALRTADWIAAELAANTLTDEAAAEPN